MSVPPPSTRMARPLSRGDLSQVFRQAERPQAPTALVGIEHEKISFRLKDGGPVPYSGPGSISALLLELCTRYGWEPHYVDGYVLSVQRGQSQVTLEPGGQVELSGSPLTNLAEVKKELDQHLCEIVSVGDDLGIGFSALAFHPNRRPLDVAFVPKPRYGLMRRYFQRTGQRGPHMMACTATVQVNLDFANEGDAFSKMAAAQLVSPYISAIFGNSPFEEGELTGWQSRRYLTWLDVDPARCGLLRFAYDPDASYDDYVRWALAAPVFGVTRGADFIEMGTVTFEDFLDHGFGHVHATFGDWFDHLGTLYPEVRLKRTIEVRGCDAGDAAHAMAVAGVWRGLLDNPAIRRQLLATFTPPRHPQAFQLAVAQNGLDAADPMGGGRILERCLHLATLAQKGLQGLSDPLADTVLRPVIDALNDGLCPADAWRQKWVGSAHEILMASRFAPF